MKKQSLRAVVVLLGLVAALIMPAAGHRVSAESTKYSVYCANNRIEVDSRTLEQMQHARGGDVCKFGEFGYLSDANAFAQRQFGGAGAKCSCK